MDFDLLNFLFYLYMHKNIYSILKEREKTKKLNRSPLKSSINQALFFSK